MLADATYGISMEYALTMPNSARRAAIEYLKAMREKQKAEMK